MRNNVGQVSDLPSPHIDVDFLHALLHDLKGPVSRVRMLGELLTRRITGLDPETQILLEHLGTSASLADEVLEAVRRYAEALHWVSNPSRFDLTGEQFDAWVCPKAMTHPLDGGGTSL